MYTKSFHVTVVGTGYVGLTTGATLAFLGHEVTCVDIDEEKIALLKSGKAPIYEPHIEALMHESAGRLRFSTDLKNSIRDSQVSFITVGTPPKADGSADLSAVASVAKGIGQALCKDQRHVIINKSTVPVGAGNYVESLVLQGYRKTHNNGHGPEMGSFSVASNPEFLREGSAVTDSLYPDRIVLGSHEPWALEILHELYRPLLEQTFAPPAFAPRPAAVESVPLVTTDVVSAETLKYAANAFLATKISFINEVAGLCEAVGADVSEVARGIGLDDRIGHRFLQAGISWGGSCFGKDTQALISTGHEFNYAMPILEASVFVNERQRLSVIEKLQHELKILKGRTIGLMGLAFKPHTDDLRDSPALDIITELVKRGAHVRVHDPVAIPACRRSFPNLPVQYACDMNELAFEADALVLVTDWPEYRSVDWEALGEVMKRRIVIDGRNHLDTELLAEHRFTYRGTGR
ncbi:MAG: UDP-glucose/GDP-mannose dehydrogenase family protein [Trueperaceae bacterium]|nr:MAG: UDP-glucose/GDP-mannose dehydrogenase family protein [Trueperaceae bacterium]